MVLNQIVAIVWQWAAVFLRSDGYAVLANFLRCHNLYRATWLTAKDRLWPLAADEVHEVGEISPHDRKIGRWFSMVYLVGVTGVGWMFFAFGLPFVISMALWVINNFESMAVASAGFWESVAVVAVLSAQWGLPFALALRERRLRKRGELV